MKQEILNKIEEMNNELYKAYTDIDKAMSKGETEFDSMMTEYEFWYQYVNESNSHILDILDENMYVLRKLASFVKTLED